MDYSKNCSLFTLYWRHNESIYFAAFEVCAQGNASVRIECVFDLECVWLSTFGCMGVCVSVCRCIRRAFQLVQCISTHLYSRIRTKIDIYVLMKNLPASTITIRVIFVFYTCIFQFILKFQEKLFIKMN